MRKVVYTVGGTGALGVGERVMSVIFPEWSLYTWGVVGAAFIALIVLTWLTEPNRIFGRKWRALRIARDEKIARLAANMIEEKRIRRIAEATMMHYTEDPEMKLRMGQKLLEKWEKEDEAARRSDDERPQ